jgi:hypothetical protein
MHRTLARLNYGRPNKNCAIDSIRSLARKGFNHLCRHSMFLDKQSADRKYEFPLHYHFSYTGTFLLNRLKYQMFHISKNNYGLKFNFVKPVVMNVYKLLG